MVEVAPVPVLHEPPVAHEILDLQVEEAPECPKEEEPEEPVEDAEQDVVNALNEKASIEEMAEPASVRNITLMEPVQSRHVGHLVAAMSKLHAKYRMLGINVMRLHTDHEKFFLHAKAQRWCEQRQNLGDDASKPEHRLLKPHLTEKVEMVTPLTFPCKQEYERVNTTLEGMKEREILDGDPSKVPHGDDEEHDHDEDDDELDDGDDGGPGPSGGKVSKKPLDDSEDIFDKDKDPEEMTLQELIDAQPDHWKSGKAGDGKIYLNDDGEKVKLNVKGYPYKIGDDGRRMFKTSLRPKGTYSPEEWRKLSQSDRNTILKAEKKKLEKKEADDKAKRLVEEKKKKAMKKEKKDSKKDKDEPKSKDDEGGDESKKDDSHSKSKKSDAGVGEIMKNKVTLPITCTSTYLDLYDIVDDDDVHGKRYIDCRKVKRNADASPCSDASTDVPDDEEYLTEWDEWSEVEKGRGPKASWSGEVWSTLSGEISRFSVATPGESTMIKNGKCVNVKDVKNIATDDDEYIAFPTMPCTSASNQSHRTKIPSGGLPVRAKKKKAYICLEMGIVARPKRTFLFFGTDLAGPVRQEDV